MAFQRYVGLSVTTKDGESVKIEDLRIDFDIERTCGKEANRAVIRVYNLTKETSAQVTEGRSNRNDFHGRHSLRKPYA